MKNIICLVFKHNWKAIYWSYSFEGGNVSSIECDQCERCDTFRLKHGVKTARWSLSEVINNE